jgi:hypothetical protein
MSDRPAPNYSPLAALAKSVLVRFVLPIIGIGLLVTYMSMISVSERGEVDRTVSEERKMLDRSAAPQRKRDDAISQRKP